MGQIFKLDPPGSLGQEGAEGILPLLSQNVLVLAKNFSLSKPQFDLLNRGLTFIPTIDLYKDQKKQLQLDIQNYHRKVKLALYFKNSSKSSVPRFTATSTWVPPQEKLPLEVDELIQKDMNMFVSHFKPRQEKFNLLQEEVQALRQLIRNKHIVIKPADKGSAVVILGREQYITEVNRQLNDTVYYKKLSEPIYPETIPIISGIIEKLKSKKFINAKQKQYLKGDIQPRERRFYILPKIHKDPVKWTVPFQIPPGRPIVSDCGSETYYTAEYIDYYLNPVSVKHPAYVKDTYHFIEIVKSLQIPENSLFFTMDVDSLYTNIDTQAGLLAVKKFFHKYPNPKRPDEEILQLLEINLTKNDFVFNGKYYLQIKGTAMGKRFAPAYANIFMACWEEEALAKCLKKPLHYLRYLDDIWGIWIDSMEEFEEFMNILNSHDSSIQLKYEIHQQSINFLDTTIYKGPAFHQTQKVDIKVFFKETDTHALLFKTSFHPRHTFKGLVKAQIIRFHRICTREMDFEEAVKTLFCALRKRGYSRTFLRHCFKSFDNRKQGDQKEIIPLITTFSSSSKTFNNKIKNNFQKIMENPQLLPGHKVISAYRRNKNLKDYLVTAKLKSLNHVKSHVLEDHFCRLKYIRNKTTNTLFKISQYFIPQTKNCIYVIFCSKCGAQYIGETRNSISTRMVQHRYNLRKKVKIHTPLIEHFLLHGLQAMKVAGLQNNLSWTDSERKKMERKWIYLLNTKQPYGLNIKNN